MGRHRPGGNMVLRTCLPCHRDRNRNRREIMRLQNLVRKSNRTKSKHQQNEALRQIRTNHSLVPALERRTMAFIKDLIRPILPAHNLAVEMANRLMRPDLSSRSPLSNRRKPLHPQIAARSLASFVSNSQPRNSIKHRHHRPARRLANSKSERNKSVE